MPITATAARRPDPGRTGPVRLLLAVALALALAVVAGLLWRVDGTAGAALGPDRLLRLADAQRTHDAAETTARAHAILASRPIDGRAFRLLAQAAEQGGDEVRADALYAVATTRAPRDRIARATAADRAFARGDIDGGINHLDALLRTAPALGDDVLPRLVAHLHDTRVQRALSLRVAGSPGWRPALAPVLVAAQADPHAGLAFLAELAGQTALTAAESAARVTLLQRLQRDAEARALWLAALPQAQRRGATAPVFDGGFEQPGVAGGYGWRVESTPGVAVAMERGDAAEGEGALWIQFEDRVVERLVVEQPLALPAGDYRLAFDARNETRSARPFAFEVACNDGGAVLAKVEIPSASVRPQWQSAQGVFAVPARCSGQRLRLRHLARSLAERRLGGALGVDAVRITRAAPVAAIGS